MSGASAKDKQESDAVDGEEFERLVAEIMEDPERVMDASLTPEQILALQRRLNPYAGAAPQASGVKRMAAVSCTNLREEYIRRFTATSLVGFLYQVLGEWSVPASARRCAVEAPGAAAPLDPAVLAGRLEAARELAGAAAEAKQEADQLELAANDLELVGAGEGEGAQEYEARKQAAIEAARHAKAKLAGLTYAAHSITYKLGKAAGDSLQAAAEEGKRFPEVASVLEQHPPPVPGAVELSAEAAKQIIKDFLSAWLEFDPSQHVRSAHDAGKLAASLASVRLPGGQTATVDVKDPGRLADPAAYPLKPAPAHALAVSAITSAPGGKAAVSCLLRDESLASAAAVALSAPEDFRQYLWPVPAGSPARPAAEVVPPQDTFHRWAYYTEVNFEELRTITEALYPERPDLDLALAIWATFEGTDAEVDAAFEEHCRRYADEVPASIKGVELGAWTLMGDFKANREKIQFYNQHTDVIKRILDRHAEDKKVGADLMRNRVRQTKARNIAEDGPDAPGLAQYKREVADRKKGLSSRGAEKVISAEEMRRLELAKGNVRAAQELEVVEQLEGTIRELLAIEAARPLTAEEARNLTHARNKLESAREMLTVPDDAVQIDVFTTGPDGLTKSHFYTRADDPTEGANFVSNDTPPSAPRLPGFLA
jgi:hypothetical protein